jgi:hypothetical protein
MTLFQMISGFWLARAIYAAAKLGVADCLKDQPQTAVELAIRTGTDAASLYRLLRALANAGVLVEDEEGYFRLTEIGVSLRSDIPGSLRAFALLHLGGEHCAAWEKLPDGLKTREIPFIHAFGEPVWQYYMQHPQSARIFDEAMAGITEITVKAVLANYDFSSAGAVIADIGGGRGRLVASILEAYPEKRGILFDLPRVVEGARRDLAEKGLADRCNVIGGDFFQSVPAGGDTYVLKWIIHDWDEEHAITILKNCHYAMHENSKLLLLETVIPPAGESHISKLLDLNMLVVTGGRERTEAEYRMLLEAAGFKMSRVVSTPSATSVIEAAYK